MIDENTKIAIEELYDGFSIIIGDDNAYFYSYDINDPDYEVLEDVFKGLGFKRVERYEVC